MSNFFTVCPGKNKCHSHSCSADRACMLNNYDESKE